jgi:hypothetical protein
MRAHGGVDVYINVFLTSALVGGEWSSSRPGRFTPGERAPCIHSIESWVGPRAGLEDVKKEKFLILQRFELRPFDRPAQQPVAITTALSRLLNIRYKSKK